MSNKKYQSIMVKVDDKITKYVLSRTFPLHIDFPFVLYYYSKKAKAVVGEAVCYDIEDVSKPEYIAEKTGHTVESTIKYLEGCDGYLWKVSDIQHYKSHRDLNFYNLKRPPGKWRYVE